ncbi:MAG: ATP-binding domain-containing protein, partial [Bdellovibrionales bacterium]|nr:ATP-binding domain-containing protein [Bdellovibrionales bacterium]
VQLVERLVADQIPKRFGFSPREVTVLSPMNQGPLGISALNQRLQARLTPRLPEAPYVRAGELEFRLGDRVCQRVNNYNLGTSGVFNGDQGEVVGLDPHAQTMTVLLWDGREVEYSRDALRELDLAYAITIHRSQGSEMPVVVMVLHDAHRIMLERQLVYTGVTRAKQLLIVVGTRSALKLSARRARSKHRYSGLRERIAAEGVP